MRFFGVQHDAPFYEDAERTSVPDGERCAGCHEPIDEDDDGFEIPRVSGGRVYFHRRCFIREVLKETVWVEKHRHE